MIKERSIRRLKGSWPPKYAVGLNGSVRKLDAAPDWVIEKGIPIDHGGWIQASKPPNLPARKDPRPLMLAEADQTASADPQPPPRLIQLGNLQYAAPVVREPDWQAKKRLFGWERNWRACGWDAGWSASRVRFRRKIIQSKDYGVITVVFVRGPRKGGKFTATVTFDRQPVHIYRLEEKKEWFDDNAHGVYKHLAKTMGYGFGLVRQTSQEEWVDLFPELEDFAGGPLTITAADGTEFRIDKSRGKPEMQTKGPRGSAVMEAMQRIPELIAANLAVLEEVRAQSLAMVGVKEALESLNGLLRATLSPPPVEPKKPDENVPGYG